MTKMIDYDLTNSLGYQISLTARLIERKFEKSLQKFGLNRTSWSVLLSLSKPDITTPSQIADYIGIDRTATSRALRHLDADGLIERLTGKQDKRTRQVKLTEKGHALLAETLPYSQENADHFRRKLADSERTELLQLLSRLREHETANLSHL